MITCANAVCVRCPHRIASTARDVQRVLKWCGARSFEHRPVSIARIAQRNLDRRQETQTEHGELGSPRRRLFTRTSAYSSPSGHAYGRNRGAQRWFREKIERSLRDSIEIRWRQQTRRCSRSPRVHKSSMPRMLHAMLSSSSSANAADPIARWQLMEADKASLPLCGRRPPPRASA